MTPETKAKIEAQAEAQCERITSTLVDADSRKRHFTKGANYGYNLAIEELSKGGEYKTFDAIDCSKTIKTIDIATLKAVQDERETIEEALRCFDTALAILLENAECRGDEDCDHCAAISLTHDKKELMDSITKKASER